MLLKMTKGTMNSKPIPRHHLRGILSVRRGVITEQGHPKAKITFFSNDTALITVAPRLKSKKHIELAFRHEIGHWVWRQFVPQYLKKGYSEELFAKAYSETFRRGSKSKPENLKNYWSTNARQKFRDLELRALRLRSK
jgi:hypothetical protein